MSKITELDKREHLITLFEKYQNFLTQTQSQAFQLYFLEDMSYQEIANLTATTRTAAYDSVKKAINKLERLEQKMVQ
ncbi:Sigma-70, region 4 [Mycoplasmopsis bovigenitalium]|uniref:Sigma-70, region 4 n=1 Tax=Mycoplasmopsis bovigenitalium TaxID=2112 RepID=A0A449A8N4_9BACT|nr:sigma factor-like helix-turn-helix DNA-binding protein [Mycoplasmopsis bovigenitalium]VEU60516.1 Sigma-70, region 4 [Mycoplasmopsis bovigenitalium]